jgi:hypothetical protein
VSAWSLACPDWIAGIQAGRTLVPDLPLRKGETERAVTIFNRLRLPDMPRSGILDPTSMPRA